VDDQHGLVRKFITTFRDPTAIDAGRPFASMPGRGLYRIRAGEWRGLVWADRAAGVIWLCCAVCLADHQNEDLAYGAFVDLGESIFPTQEERKEASQEQRIAHALRAMRDAMQSAHDFPGSWEGARLRCADQELDDAETIGRAYVEQIEEDGDELVDRFLITVTKPPAGISADDWIDLVVARVFPGDEPVFPVRTDDLPYGSEFRIGPEIALAQQA
jgi:hypothetical protein